MHVIEDVEFNLFILDTANQLQHESFVSIEDLVLHRNLALIPCSLSVNTLHLVLLPFQILKILRHGLILYSFRFHDRHLLRLLRPSHHLNFLKFIHRHLFVLLSPGFSLRHLPQVHFGVYGHFVHILECPV